MEYVPGIKINRIKQLDNLGVDRKKYVLIVEYWSSMGFNLLCQLTLVAYVANFNLFQVRPVCC